MLRDVVPSPRFLPSIFIAHRVQQSRCVANSRSRAFRKSICAQEKSLRIFTYEYALGRTRTHETEVRTSMHSGGLELTKLNYTRLEDNLIRHIWPTVAHCGGHSQVTLRLISVVPAALVILGVVRASKTFVHAATSRRLEPTALVHRSMRASVREMERLLTSSRQEEKDRPNSSRILDQLLWEIIFGPSTLRFLADHTRSTRRDDQKHR